MKNKTPKQLLKDLNDLDIRKNAASNPSATPEVLLKALDDSNGLVRRFASMNPNATPELLLKAMNDEDSYVRCSAAENSNATTEVLLKALDDNDFFVRRNAVLNPNATPEVLLKALYNKSTYVRACAASNPLVKKVDIPLKKWISLVVSGCFKGSMNNIPSHVKRNPKYKSAVLLSKLAK